MPDHNPSVGEFPTIREDAFHQTLTIGGLRHSVALDQFYAALAKAQSELQNPAFNQVARKFIRREGKQVEFRYADLAAVLNAVRPPLARNGIAVMQILATSPDGKTWLQTRLGHASGQWMEWQLELPAIVSGGLQDWGADVTYCRRTSMSAATGIAGEQGQEEEAVAAAAAVGESVDSERGNEPPFDGGQPVTAAAPAPQPEGPSLTGLIGRIRKAVAGKEQAEKEQIGQQLWLECADAFRAASVTEIGLYVDRYHGTVGARPPAIEGLAYPTERDIP